MKEQGYLDKLFIEKYIPSPEVRELLAASGRALTEWEKATLIWNISLLYEEKLKELKEEAKIDAVEALITAIGTVTLESEKAITDARKAYDDLSDAQKAKVENYNVLNEAEKALAIFKMDKVDTKKAYKDTGDYLEKQVKEYGLTVNSIGGEWIVVGLERAGRKTPKLEDYYNEVVKFVQ